MAFDTPNGTRGARQPGRSRLERWGNQRMVASLRRKGDRRGEKLVLVTVGRKTGTERMTPVRWFPDGDARYLGEARRVVREYLDEHLADRIAATSAA